jgi:hypothetical protein
MFFDLTKTIMNDGDITDYNFPIMAETTKQSYEFIKKLLTNSEDKVLSLYL